MTNPLQFISQVRAEIGKIVWPGRREVVTTSIMVVIFKRPDEVALGKGPKIGWLDGIIQSFQDRAMEWSQSLTPGMAEVGIVALLVVVVFAIKGACQYGSHVVLARIGNNIVARQQERISNHILAQSLAFLVQFPTADLISRVSRAAVSTRDVMNLLMLRAQDVLTAVGLVSMMFLLDWRFALITLFIMAPIVGALAAILRRIRKIAHAEFQSSIQVVNTVQEAIAGNKLIKSYNLEPHMTGRFDEAIRAGRVGVKPLRERYIALHQRDPEEAAALIGALPTIGGELPEAQPALQGFSSSRSIVPELDMR